MLCIKILFFLEGILGSKYIFFNVWLKVMRGVKDAHVMTKEMFWDTGILPLLHVLFL